MKNVLNGLCFFSLLGFTFSVNAKSSYSQLDLPKVERVGVMKHPVVYSSPKLKLKKSNQAGILVYQKMIARWGVHRFEVGVSEFNCSSQRKCEFNQWISLAMFEKCEQRPGAKSIRCYNKVSGSSIANSDQYSYSTKGYLETFENDFEREFSSSSRTNSMNEVEFPERGSDYWEYPASAF